MNAMACQDAANERVLTREFHFSHQHFERLRQFVTAQTGIMLTTAKKDMMYSRLSKHIRRQHQGSFDQFCAAIEAGEPDQCDYLINAITTNLTAFFREKHHFEFLSERVIPELRQRNHTSKRIRIWSAGCSTGEEAYSIALCLQQALPEIDQWDIQILATDLDANVLEKARAGIYAYERIESLTAAQQKQGFLLGQGVNRGRVKVQPKLAERVKFKRLNLLDDWPMRGPFDVIFCRNVVIYFDKAIQRQLFDRYANLLTPTGFLFIGHSESLNQVSDRFSALGQTIYRRHA